MARASTMMTRQEPDRNLVRNVVLFASLPTPKDFGGFKRNRVGHPCRPTGAAAKFGHACVQKPCAIVQPLTPPPPLTSLTLHPHHAPNPRAYPSEHLAFDKLLAQIHRSNQGHGHRVRWVSVRACAWLLGR